MPTFIATRAAKTPLVVDHLYVPGHQSASNAEAQRLPWCLAKVEALDLKHVPAVVDHQDFSSGFLLFSSSGLPTRPRLSKHEPIRLSQHVKQTMKQPAAANISEDGLNAARAVLEAFAQQNWISLFLCSIVQVA